ncbi:MAG TPA: Flp pilus assembly protein CpaB [Caulobacteraceae bacterium]|jgi:pilus assembly protein CpaB|nr:Flp pilus assembly protein CpaB [Caulobacteraceae bacterium]
MRTGTIVSLGASAVLGIGALIVARVWLPTTTPIAVAGKPPQLSAQMVPVVVARADIPYGTKLDPSKLEIEQLPAGTAPQGAYSTTAQILTQAGGAPVVLTPISAREPLLPTKLSVGGARPTIAAALDDGMRAYTIMVSDVAGVGGHVLPGDRVDIVLTRELPKPADSTETCDCKHYIADVVLQDVRVMGMDLNADPTSSTPAVAHTATLQVSVEDAQKLAVAAQSGTLSLALRRTGSAEVTPVRTVALADLRVGGALRDPSAGAAAHPHASHREHHGAPAAAAPMMPMTPPTHAVTVVHGDTSTSVQVPADRGAGA